jgi:hypothetical protein
MFKGGMPNMQQMMKQMQKMQEAMARVQEDLANRSVTGDAGGGMVKVTVSGKQQILKVEINAEVVNAAEKDLLEDMVLTATNQALEKAAALAQEEMKKVTGGVVPGLPGF